MMTKAMTGKGSDQGFTLIEVMAAMVILGVGILAIVSMQVQMMNYNSSSKRQSEGYNWAMDRVERLLNLPYTDAQLTVTNSSPSIVGDGNVDTDPNQDGTADVYTVEWDVADNPNLANSRIVNVFVRRNGSEIARIDFTRVESRI